MKTDKKSILVMTVRTDDGKFDVNLSEDVSNAWVMLELIDSIEPRLVKKHWDEFHNQVA